MPPERQGAKRKHEVLSSEDLEPSCLRWAGTVCDMGTTVICAERVLPHPRPHVWSLLADPRHHPLFDASGMVCGTASAAPRAVGDVFRMDMRYSDGDTVEHYRSDNHVTRYVEGEAIAWATALPDGEPLGWIWSYELGDESAGARVRLIYDWSDTSAENIRRFGVPLVDRRGLEESLRFLERACQPSRSAGTLCDHERQRRHR